MCVSFASATDFSWIVGGKGTGAGKATTNAGVYNIANSTWDNAMGANGTFRFDINTTAIADGGGGTMLVDITDGQANANWLGVGVYFHNSEGIEPDARAQIINVNTGVSPDVIIIELPWINGDTADITVGGSLVNPGDVWDSDDASTGIYLGNADTHKIWIRALADYTTVDESDSILYVNTAGTAAAPIIWEAHFAEVASEKGDFGVVTFNATGIGNGIETAIGGSVYHVFIGLSIELANDDGLNGNGSTDDFISVIRCQFINNGIWGMQADRDNVVLFCDFDTNAGGFDGGVRNIAIDSVFQNNTGDGYYTDSGTVIGCLSFDNGDTQIRVGTARDIVYGCTVDGDNGAGTEGIYQDGASAAFWTCINNLVTNCDVGVQDDSTLRQAAILYNNLYNNNTPDTNTNITPIPSDSDIWGNVVDPGNLFSSGYILHDDNKGKGTDVSFTKAYWDDFNGGAGDNPPTPLSGLSFMDMGGLQREEAGIGGGGQPVIGGSVVR